MVDFFIFFKRQHERSEIIKTTLGILIITISVLIAYFPLFTAPSVPIPDDLIRTHMYGDLIFKENVKQFGQIGLWDQYSSFGQPLIGGVSSQFYPFSLIYLMFENSIRGISASLFVHLLLGALSMYSFLRIVKVNNLVAATAGVIFVSNYYIESVVNTGSLSDIYNLPWMVVAFLGVYIALEKEKTIFAFVSGFAIAMHVMSMSLFSVYFTSILISLYVLYSLLHGIFMKKENAISLVKSHLRVGIIIYLFAFGVSAVKLLPVLEFSLYSIREKMPLYGDGNPFHDAWRFYSYREIIQWINSFVARGGLINYYTPVNSAIVLGMFFGIFFKGNKLTYFLFLILSVAYLSLLGPLFYIDMYSFFYTFFPGISTIEDPIRFRILINFATPALFAFGSAKLLSLLREKVKNRRIYFLSYTCLVILLVVIIFGSVAYVRGQMEHFYVSDRLKAHAEQEEFSNEKSEILKNIKSMGSNAHIVVVGDKGKSDEIFSYTALKNGFSLLNPQLQSFTPKYGYFPLDITIPNPKFREEYFRFKEPEKAAAKLLTLFKAYNAKFVILDKDSDLLKHLVADDSIEYDRKVLYEIPHASEYVWESTYNILLVADTVFNDHNAFMTRYLMTASHFDPTNTSIISSSTLSDTEMFSNLELFDGIIITNPNKLTIDQKTKISRYHDNGGIVTTLKFSENQYEDYRVISFSLFSDYPALFLDNLELEKYNSFLNNIYNLKKNQPIPPLLLFDSPEKKKIKYVSESKGILILSDTYYPGWKATSGNGRDLPLAMSNGLSKAILIPEGGEQEINVRFVSVLFYLGFIISVVTLLGSLAVLIFKHRSVAK